MKVYNQDGKFITGQIPNNLTGGNSDGPGYDSIPLAILKDNNRRIKCLRFFANRL